MKITNAGVPLLVQYYVVFIIQTTYTLSGKK